MPHGLLHDLSFAFDTLTLFFLRYEGTRHIYTDTETPAAKQAAFEEKTALRNQFRPLDDDEIEFLDDVRQSKRAEEERLRRETEEGLKAFREAQKGGGTEASGEAGEGEEIVEDWGAGRKRKRRERDVKGVKRRVSSSAAEEKDSVGERRKESAGPERKGSVEEGAAEAKDTEAESKPPEPEKKPKLGLVDYGSDESE